MVAHSGTVDRTRGLLHNLASHGATGVTSAGISQSLGGGKQIAQTGIGLDCVEVGTAAQKRHTLSVCHQRH
jgi:hypothetical protein